ncbi:DUF4296 domain-containing protein [Lacinutrix jangbogonensis]|uniref:DUF4296 domain-containing protein n=1 Tax=Lacinutrix jangbogonensis TaxID=1469557 RepID=UPI00068DB392|nr:DUF4296 domain-containing protein [Lacinutrix jangbogonensis]
MKINHISFLVLLLIFNSCYTVEKPNRPNNLISEDNMVNVLVDIAIMSSAKGVNKSKIEQNGIVPDEYIYKKNNIDSTLFAESNAYYAFDINKYDAIYLRVKDSLSLLRDQYKAIDTKEKKEKEVKDSTRRAKINASKRAKINNKAKVIPVGRDGLVPLKKS